MSKIVCILENVWGNIGDTCPMVFAPHPANRSLSNIQTSNISDIIINILKQNEQNINE